VIAVIETKRDSAHDDDDDDDDDVLSLESLMAFFPVRRCFDTIAFHARAQPRQLLLKWNAIGCAQSVAFCNAVRANAGVCASTDIFLDWHHNTTSDKRRISLQMVRIFETLKLHNE
jgi:hypothetical protein